MILCPHREELRTSKIARVARQGFLCLFSLLLMRVACAGTRKESKPLVLDLPGFRRAFIVVADIPGPIGKTYAGWRLDKTYSARYAAEFLQRYIKLVTGAELRIVSATQATAAPYRPWILVGKSKLTDFVEAERRKLPPEGFIIRREGTKIAIVGEIADEDDMPEYRGADRGTLFGVYEFLERVYGVRWYFPGELGVKIPRRQRVAIYNLEIKDAPVFRMRLCGLRPSREKGPLSDLHPCIRPGNTTGFWTNHTYFTWYKYADRFPEIFAVGPDGRRNTTNKPPTKNSQNHINFLHPKVLEIELQRLKEFYEKGERHWPFSLWPSSKYVRFFPRDNENVYHDCSPDSRALWTPERENSMLSEIIFGYASKLARAISEIYPGKRLAFGAYAGFLYPPLTVKMPDNADVLICTIKGNSLLVSRAHWNYNVELVTQWFEHLGKDRSRVFLWEYFCYPNHHLQFYPHTMKRWFQFCRDKVMGAFNNGFPNRGATEMKYRLSILNGWLWHKLLWNPDADVDALITQFCADLFGPSASAMLRAFNLCITRYETAGSKLSLNPGCCSYIPRRTLYRAIYPPEFTKELKETIAKARKAAKPYTLEGKRVEYFAEAFDEFFAEAEDFYRADKPPPEKSVPKVEKAPRIDGVLNEPVWDSTDPLRLQTWKLGKRAEPATQVSLLHDGSFLYIGARLELSPDSVPLAKGNHRDDPAILGDDYFAVDIDSVPQRWLDLPSFFRIMVNPAGFIADGIKIVPVVYRNLHRSAWFPHWNGNGILAATHKRKADWTLELKIPLRELYINGQSVRAQFLRQNRSTRQGLWTWSPMLIESYEYDLDRMGTLLLQ